MKCVASGGRRRPASPVQATPTSEGIAYVNVFTTQNGVTSVTSIPLRAGTAAAKLRPGGDLKKVPAGESVISMPRT